MTDFGEYVALPKPDDETPVLLLAERLDVAQQHLFAAATLYTRLPVKNFADRVVEASSEVTDTMQKSFDWILDDEETSDIDKAGMLVSILDDDARKRSTHFRTLFPDRELFDNPGPSREEKVEHVVQHLLEGTENEELSDEVMSWYFDNAVKDVRELEEAVTASRNAKLLKAGRFIGKHALDVLKAGVGAAAGVTIAMQLAKKRQ
jgi:hypothetical protein